MTPPVSNQILDLVVIQSPEGNPWTIDSSDQIAVVGSEGGHFPPEKVAVALSALGIQRIPVGTKIRELKGYVRAIQRAFAVNCNQDPETFHNHLDVAQRMAKRSGINVDPVELPALKKNYAEASQALVPIIKGELERGEFREAFAHVGWAHFYGQKGGHYPEELESLIECVTELRTAAGKYEEGDIYVGELRIERAQYMAQKLSISIDKSVDWVNQFMPKVKTE